MDEHDREIIATLAEKLMGWKVCGEPDPHWGSVDPPRLVFLFEPPGLEQAVQLGTGRPHGEPWNPLEDWRAAGEVLKQMQNTLSIRRWLQFTGEIQRAVGMTSLPNVLSVLTPRLIAEAAYEAVKEADDA